METFNHCRSKNATISCQLFLLNIEEKWLPEKVVIRKQSFFILMLGAKWTENNGDDNDEDEDSYNISKTSNAI